MRIRSRYTRHEGHRLTALLDKRKHLSGSEREQSMPINKQKIRRQIVINGERVWVTANSEQEYVNKLLRLSGAMKPRSKTRHNFEEYAERWFTIFSEPNIEHVTAVTYRRQLDKHIYPILKSKTVEEISFADIQAVFNAMGDAKRETKNKTKIVLNQIFKLAIDEHLIMANPLQSTSLRIKGLDSTETEPYSVEQMKYLAAHLSDVKDVYERAWLALSISLPLRPEEVLGLRWQDIDDDGTLQVRSTVTHPDRNRPEFKPYPKTASSRRILTIPAKTFTYLPLRGDPDEFVIGGKDPISYTKLRGFRKRIQRDTGFSETITPRRFRTTVATDISDTTHDLKLVQHMLGHSTPQMTLKHYDKGRKSSLDASQAIKDCYGL